MDDTREANASPPRDALQAERLEHERAIGLMGLAAGPVFPPAHLKERVLRSLPSGNNGLEPLSAGPVEIRPGISLVRSNLLPWGDHPSPGVRIKEVLSDPSSGSRCLLIELDAGSVYPDHEHDVVEELFVIRGSFSVAGKVLRSGDFCRSEPGTKDWNITSEEGALLLVSLGAPGLAAVGPA